MSKIQSLFSKRAVMAGLLAGSAVLAATSFAMPGGVGGPGGPGCEARQGQQAQRQEMRQAFRKDMRAKRLAVLKDKLQLQPRQEAAWQAFTNAVPGKGPMAREGRQALRDELGKLSTPERLDRMMARADERRARMVQGAEAVKQFYAQLSPEQQKVFDAEARPFREGRHGHHRHHGGPRWQS